MADSSTTIRGHLVKAAAAGLLTLSIFASPKRPSQSSLLKSLSLAHRGGVEIITVNKEPEELWQTAAAVLDVTSKNIRRSGVATIPESLRLGPGVGVARGQRGLMWIC